MIAVLTAVIVLVPAVWIVSTRIQQQAQSAGSAALYSIGIAFVGGLVGMLMVASIGAAVGIGPLAFGISATAWLAACVLMATAAGVRRVAELTRSESR